MTKQIVKGTRIHARWFQVTDLIPVLAGMQDKVTGEWRDVIGTVRHIRGDHPVNPTTIGLWVEPDGGGDEVVVDTKHVIAVL